MFSRYKSFEKDLFSIGFNTPDARVVIPAKAGIQKSRKAGRTLA